MHRARCLACPQGDMGLVASKRVNGGAQGQTTQSSQGWGPGIAGLQDSSRKD